MTSSKPIVLHLGDPVKWNTEYYEQFSKDFTVIRPSAEERTRDEFIKALKEKRWGDFNAIFRPFWNTGGEMGRWDRELISLVPASCKVSASAGAGFDWVRTLSKKCCWEKGHVEMCLMRWFELPRLNSD
jgi:hypothetical protein